MNYIKICFFFFSNIYKKKEKNIRRKMWNGSVLMETECLNTEFQSPLTYSTFCFVDNESNSN